MWITIHNAAALKDGQKFILADVEQLQSENEKLKEAYDNLLRCILGTIEGYMGIPDDAIGHLREGLAMAKETLKGKK